jgi:hypothetical protein
LTSLTVCGFEQKMQGFLWPVKCCDANTTTTNRSFQSVRVYYAGTGKSATASVHALD